MRAVVSMGLVLLAAGCAERPRPEAEASRPSVAVRVIPVHEAAMTSYVEAGGNVRAKTTAVVSSRIVAVIATIAVRPGDHVRRGDVLIRLDARDAAATSAQAQAAARAADLTATAADSDVASAEAALVLARATDERVSGLYARRSATADERDRAHAEKAAAEARAAAARARQQSALAARDAARDAARTSDIVSGYATIAAPFDGVVTERLADPGSIASPGMPLLTLEAAGTYRLEVPLDESRAALVRTGQPVEVLFDTPALPGSLTLGVSEIGRLESASHGFLVKIDLPDGPWRSGMFGRARFAGTERRTLAVPESALVRRGQLTFVFVAEDGRRARLRPISVGAAVRGSVEVSAGLRDGEEVIDAPGAALEDGTPILRGDR